MFASCRITAAVCHFISSAFPIDGVRGIMFYVCPSAYAYMCAPMEAFLTDLTLIAIYCCM